MIERREDPDITPLPCMLLPLPSLILKAPRVGGG